MAIRNPGLLATAILALAASLSSGPAPAQEPSAPPAAGDPQSAEPPAADEAEDEGFQNGLWVYVGFGAASGDSINTSIKNASLINAPPSAPDALSSVNIDEFDYGRAEIGWKLPDKKGDFRLRFDGYSETKYEFETLGRSEGQVRWNLRAADGTIRVEQNGTANVAEKPITDNLLNRANHWDLLYGRTWGGRRFSGRWWAGLRYFTYEGNLLAGSWLRLSGNGQIGLQFTDTASLNLLNFSQETTGFGPTGAMEADFNFFDRRLVLYLSGQLSFMFTELKTDSGPFFTFVTAEDPTVLVPIATKLSSSREKSSWQTAAELGARWNFRWGLTIDVAYLINGYLDAILLPSQLPIPNAATQTPPQGENTLFATHDLVLDGWRVGVGFQF